MANDSCERVLRSVLGPGGPTAERRVGLSDRRNRRSGGLQGQPDASNAIDSTWKVRDVAEFLQASESWVRHAAAGGRLPCTKIGGLLRFDPDEIRSLARPEAPARILPRR